MGPSLAIATSAAALVVASAAAMRLSLPLPTTAQLQWQRGEVMALVHFNMATFYQDGDPGCDASNWEGPTGSSNPASFAPAKLNVSQWVDSFKEVGADHAVITAKHGCGFLLWPTNVLLPNGDPYYYHISPDVAGGDLVRLFVDTVRAAGMGVGAYYSLTNKVGLRNVRMMLSCS